MHHLHLNSRWRAHQTAPSGVHQHTAPVVVVLVVVLDVFVVVILFLVAAVVVVIVIVVVVIVFVVVDMIVVIVDMLCLLSLLTCLLSLFTSLLLLLLTTTHSEWWFSCCRGTRVRVHLRRTAQSEGGLVREQPLPEGFWCPLQAGQAEGPAPSLHPGLPETRRLPAQW